MADLEVSMKKNKISIIMLIMGVCFIISGLVSIYWHNWGVAIIQVAMGIVEFTLAILQKKNE